MATVVGDIVHPRYQGIQSWKVKKVAKLAKLIKYRDALLGDVCYAPKILLLESMSMGEILWFTYWVSTSRTKDEVKWGQRPPILEESVLLELMKDAIRQDMFSSKFLKELKEEIQIKL